MDKLFDAIATGMKSGEIVSFSRDGDTVSVELGAAKPKAKRGRKAKPKETESNAGNTQSLSDTLRSY